MDSGQSKQQPNLNAVWEESDEVSDDESAKVLTPDLSPQKKMEAILPWVDPEERITVDFEDMSNVNATVLGCTEEMIDLELEAMFARPRQRAAIPLRFVQVGEDRSRYTRNPEKPLRHARLWLLIQQRQSELIWVNP